MEECVTAKLRYGASGRVCNCQIKVTSRASGVYFTLPMHPPTHLQVTKNRFDGDLGKFALDWEKSSLTLSGYFRSHQGEDKASPASEHAPPSLKQSGNYGNRTGSSAGGGRWYMNKSRSEGVCVCACSVSIGMCV